MSPPHVWRARSALATTVFLLLLPACDDTRAEFSTSRPGDEAARLDGRAAGIEPLVLVPPQHVAAGDATKLRVELRGRRDVERLDYAAVRVHGEQWILDEQKQGAARVLEAELGARRGTSVFSVVARPFELASGLRVQRSAKSMSYIRRGAWAEVEASPAASARFGSELEIVPLRDPHAVELGDDLQLRVRFYGPGLQGATLVAAQLRDDGPREVFRGRTGSVGEIDVPISRAGLWLLTVEHRSAATEETPETLHVASLSFRTGGQG